MRASLDATGSTSIIQLIIVCVWVWVLGVAVWRRRRRLYTCIVSCLLLCLYARCRAEVDRKKQSVAWIVPKLVGGAEVPPPLSLPTPHPPRLFLSLSLSLCRWLGARRASLRERERETTREREREKEPGEPRYEPLSLTRSLVLAPSLSSPPPRDHPLFSTLNKACVK